MREVLKPPKVIILGNNQKMFDGISEAKLKHKVRHGESYEFHVINAEATYDHQNNSWKVKLKIMEKGVEKEFYIEEKRGSAKDYSSLDRMVKRLSTHGLKKILVDLTSL